MHLCECRMDATLEELTSLVNATHGVLHVCMCVYRMDATLKELTSLVKEVNPDARRKGTFFDFAIVYPDPRSPTYRLRDIGTTCSGRKTADDTVTLASKKFTIGDYLDIAIAPPRAGPPPPMRNRGRPY